MRTSTVIISLGIGAACLGAAWLTTPKQQARHQAHAPPDTFAIGFDVPSATGLSITTGGTHASLARSATGGWTLSLPTTDPGTPATNWPANPEAVRVVLNELATQAIEAAQQDPTPEHAPEPLAAVTIELPDGPTSIGVLAQALGGRLPVLVSTPGLGPRRGFVPASRFRPTDAGQLAALAAPNPFDTPGVITSVTIDPASGPAFTVERSRGVWRAAPTQGSPAISARLDQDAVRSMVDTLRSLRAASVIVPADVSAPQDPFLVISTESELPRAAGTAPRRLTASLAIAARPGPDGLTNALATRSDSAGTQDAGTHRLHVRIDPETFPALPATLGTLIAPAPLPWPADEAAAFGLSDPSNSEGAQTLTRSLQGWRINGEPAAPETAEALRTLLDALASPARGIRIGGMSWAANQGEPAPELFATIAPIGAGDRAGLHLDPSAPKAWHGGAEWTLDIDAARYTEALETLTRALAPTP